MDKCATINFIDENIRKIPEVRDYASHFFTIGNTSNFSIGFKMDYDLPLIDSVKSAIEEICSAWGSSMFKTMKPAWKIHHKKKFNYHTFENNPLPKEVYISYQIWLSGKEIC